MARNRMLVTLTDHNLEKLRLIAFIRKQRISQVLQSMIDALPDPEGIPEYLAREEGGSSNV